MRQNAVMLQVRAGQQPAPATDASAACQAGRRGAACLETGEGAAAGPPTALGERRAYPGDTADEGAVREAPQHRHGPGHEDKGTDRQDNSTG